MKTWIGVGLLVAALAACRGGDDAARGKGRPPVPVTAARAQIEEVPTTVHAFGTVEANHIVAVRSQVEGVLQEVGFHEGDEVRKGQVLFQIDPRPFQAALAQAEKVLARDQASLAAAESDAKRYGALLEKDYVSKQQAQAANSSAAALAATVGADHATLKMATLSLAYCTIRAPITGRTGQLNYQQGNLIKANGDTPLVTIAQVKPIRVSFSVPSDGLSSLRSHQNDHLEVDVTPGRRQSNGDEPPTPAGSAPAKGVLTFIDNGVDQTTGTILLKADFPNQDESLWPGEFVQVELTLGKEKSLVIPAEAVETGQEGTYVFVVKPDGTVESRPVKVSRIDAQIALIADGVKAGEMVVTDGQLRLVSGAKVTVRDEPAPAAHAATQEARQ